MKIRDFIATRVAVGCLIAIICCSLTISRCVYFLCCCCWRDHHLGNPKKRVCVGCGLSYGTQFRIFGLSKYRSSQVVFIVNSKKTFTALWRLFK
jgi:hypothetical protein